MRWISRRMELDDGMMGLSRCLPHDLVGVLSAEFLRQVTFIQVRNSILSFFNNDSSWSFYSARVPTSIYRSNQICYATTRFCRALEDCSSHALSRTMLLASSRVSGVEWGMPDSVLHPSKSPSIRAVEGSAVRY